MPGRHRPTPPAPRTPHPTWCAGGHRCALGEHRSDPLRIDLPNVGALVVTRVQGTDGHEYAEVRGNLRLTPDEPRARQQLGRLLDDLTTLMRAARRAA
ncbi:MAG: hypothetical protein HKP61_21895 [Dactylosporangium sp.]|nr:hypothetical protein [Dactylosporangium sp.]NNJ63533.1 hypothetical protein [Dactylosporangium sp.]